MTSRIVRGGGSVSGMGLEASCSWPPMHMLATSSVLSNEGRRGAASLCAARVSRGSLAQRGRLRSRASRSCALRTVLTSLRGEHSTAKLALRGEPDLRRSGLWRGAVVTPVFTELLRSATRERAVVLANDEVRELGSSRVAPSWLDSPSTRLA